MADVSRIELDVRVTSKGKTITSVRVPPHINVNVGRVKRDDGR